MLWVIKFDSLVTLAKCHWENYGTTLGIRADNHLEMITARLEGKPDVLTVRSLTSSSGSNVDGLHHINHQYERGRWQNDPNSQLSNLSGKRAWDASADR